MWSKDSKRNESGSDDDSDEDSSEEESDDEPGPSAAAAELSREDRKKEKQARKAAAIAKAKAAAIQVGDLPPSDSDEDSDSDDDDMPANPNHSKAARKQAIAPVAKKAADTDADVDEAAAGVAKMGVSKQPMSRKERDSQEAALAKERYMKMHLAGKTDEAKADMARLAEIREKRAADKARRDVCCCYPCPGVLISPVTNDGR